jgi:molybdopterin-containing oxidoreductase family membrane subunit
VGVFVGTLAMFAVGILLFFRYIPMMAISELKGVLHSDENRSNDENENKE